MFKNLFKREHWCLVKTIKIDADNMIERGFGYYHLFESSKGNRKVEFAATIKVSSKFNEEMKQMSVYQEKIVRWLSGRYDPEIPRYIDIPEEEIMSALKGKL